jgi:uncharacterized membrane protein
MKAWLMTVGDALRASYWFVPVVMVTLALMLAAGTLWLDSSYPDAMGDWPLVYGGEPETARELLATLTGSMITTVSFVFSVLIVSLTLAAGQYGPRLLRDFMQDRGVQIVLGAFVATFVFCLIVLSRVRINSQTLTASVTAAMVLALSSFALLIYFIHHASSKLQVDNVIASVSRQLRKSIDQMHKHRKENAEPAEPLQNQLPDDIEDNSRPLSAHKVGYIQFVDYKHLGAYAREHNLIIQLERRAGEFVVSGQTLARVYPADRAADDRLRPMRRHIAINSQRTPVQDLEFSIQELCEVALRGLSPSVNDPFMANTCIDYLGAAICRFLDHPGPTPLHADRDGRLRIITPVVSFEGLMDAAFDRIRQSLDFHTGVAIRMLATMRSIVPHVRTSPQWQHLLHHGGLVRSAILRKAPEPTDKAQVEESYLTLQASVNEMLATGGPS